MDWMKNEGRNPDQLDGLWSQYRAACPDPDASPEFMPNLWRKIEARRHETFSVFRRLAQVCVAATAAVLLVGTLLMPTAPVEDVLDSGTYDEVLAAEHADASYAAALPAELGDAQ
jgi:hypothetical protein